MPSSGRRLRSYYSDDSAYEKLVMNKTKDIRGAFPFPWVCASFFNSLAESLMNEVDAPAENEADSVSVVGAGGGT